MRLIFSVLLTAALALTGVTACGGTTTDGNGNGNDKDEDNDEPPLANGCNVRVAGTWQGSTQPDELVLAGDGSFRYIGFDGCENSGTFACPDASASKASMKVSVSESTGGYCLAKGTHTCSFDLSGNTLTYDCSGEGNLHYRRK